MQARKRDGRKRDAACAVPTMHRQSEDSLPGGPWDGGGMENADLGNVSGLCTSSVASESR